MSSFILRGNDDDVIIDDQDDTVTDPYWSQASCLASNYDWNQPSYDLREYFPYSSGLSSPSTITSEDEEVKWCIEYDRAVKKHHPEFDHGFYIDIHHIIRTTGWILQGGYIPMTVVVIPAMIGQRISVSPTQAVLRQIYSITSRI